jgi:AraC-like DNA-binding protein
MTSTVAQNQFDCDEAGRAILVIALERHDPKVLSLVLATLALASVRGRPYHIIFRDEGAQMPPDDGPAWDGVETAPSHLRAIFTVGACDKEPLGDVRGVQGADGPVARPSSIETVDASPCSDPRVGPGCTGNDVPLNSAAVAVAAVLHLVAEDQGPPLAAEIATLLAPLTPTGWATFLGGVSGIEAGQRRVLNDLCGAIEDDPTADHSLDALAKRAGFSARHLTRLFQEQLGETPGRYVEGVRIRAARQALETTSLSLAAVARRTGFRSVETMRRAFLRDGGVSPAAYRLTLQRVA